MKATGGRANPTAPFCSDRPINQTTHMTENIIPPQSWFARLLTHLFAYESMSGAGQCPVYLERWTIGGWFFNLFGWAVYLHHFLGDDWAIDPHDHPRRFISIGLRGWYWEDVFLKKEGPAPFTLGYHFDTQKHTAPWIRSFPADHLHRIRASEAGGRTWTLCIVLGKSRGWGFVRDGVWMPFKKYVFGGKARKSC